MTARKSTLHLARNPAGFTLTEMLIVIGIIVLLAALALPVLLRARAAGDRAAVKVMFTGIDVALEAYRADFGDYPKPAAGERGYHVLCKALLSPGGIAPASAATMWLNNHLYKIGDRVLRGGVTYICISQHRAASGVGGNEPGATDQYCQWPIAWLIVNTSDIDGVVGPGFLVRAGGKIYSAYLNPDKFKSIGGSIADTFGMPIFYYPAPPGRNIYLTNGYLYPGSNAQYDQSQNDVAYFRRPDPVLTASTKLNWEYDDRYSAQRQRIMMGDRNANGQIDPNESPAYTGPYLLWSAGPDRQFGCGDGFPLGTATLVDLPASAIDRCDDVTSFR